MTSTTATPAQKTKSDLGWRMETDPMEMEMEMQMEMEMEMG